MYLENNIYFITTNEYLEFVDKSNIMYCYLMLFLHLKKIKLYLHNQIKKQVIFNLLIEVFG